MPFFFFDPTFVLLIPAVILALWAQMRVKSTYHKYARVRSASGLTGAQVARRLLNMHGLNDVEVEAVAGELSDHYDPRSKTVRLSEVVYNKTSVAALGVAAHEVGHALQHSKGYAPLAIRNALLGPANFGSTLAFPIFLVGFFFSTGAGWLMDLGIYLFLAVLAFQVVTLPVEFNASRNAMSDLRSAGILARDEATYASKVLNAAALTYVAAAAVSLMHLIRLLILRSARS